MGITSTGIGSGLDVSSIVTQLMSAERAPINILQTKQTANNAKLSAYGSVKSAVSTFQTALKGLSTAGLGARTGTSSNPTTLGVTAGTDAIPGSYAIEVTQLAKQTKLSSAGHADSAALMGSGNMSIQVGAKTAVTIPAGDYSLDTLSKAINAAQAGVSATIVNDGSASHLVITATDSGVANTVKITADGGMAEFTFDPAAPPPGPGPVMAQNQAGQDAMLKIDNIAITKPSNTITDAVSGLTLNLLQTTTAGSSVNVTVAVDKAAAKTAVTGLVDAYNKLSSTIKTMTAYNPSSKTSAVLNGDSGAASIMTALRKELTTATAGAGGLKTLSDIGITFQRDGTLAADDTKLAKALDTNFSGVTALFSGTDGFATRLTAATTALLGTTGVISNRTNNLNSAIKQNSTHQDELESRMANIEKRYRAQFSGLDTIMSKMQSTSNFLTQQLSAIARNN